ncbi:uncharacterized protein LOC131166525 [Malania oleifera]|uniref:uncharacterized protein LOC131166525 n=1 Tax=Malania oleifera TaxID=397392 RepID=UPI0025ADF7FD|nr:uncharacterized protein LOC131166525 [Malania oleifera]
MKRALRIKNKLGFIDGSIREPIDPDSSLMDHWLRCNDIVITWLQNSMSVDIKCNTLYAKTAHQLWVELEHHLAQQNAPRIYEIKQGIAALMQQQDSEEKRREISSDPSLTEPLALLVKDNTRQLTPQNSSQRRDKYYCSHCKIHGHSLERCFKANSSKPVCNHCHIPGHTTEKCYKLHGYPPGHRLHGRTPPIGTYAHQVSSSPLPVPEQGTHGGQSTITQEQYQELMAILRQTSQASVHSVQTAIASPPDAHIPQFSGIPLYLLAYTSKPKDILVVPWIIGTGATDHMVCATCFFTSITAEVSYSVTLPNGEAVAVTHIGTVRPTKDLILHNVLCVPSFSFNLISARKLAHTLKCCLIFLSKKCFIQDLLTWRTTGMGEVKNGLYHLLQNEVPPASKPCPKPPTYHHKQLPYTLLQTQFSMNAQNTLS